jgi:hypothetical protein
MEKTNATRLKLRKRAFLKIWAATCSRPAASEMMRRKKETTSDGDLTSPEKVLNSYSLLRTAIIVPLLSQAHRTFREAVSVIITI